MGKRERERDADGKGERGATRIWQMFSAHPRRVPAPGPGRGLAWAGTLRGFGPGNPPQARERFVIVMQKLRKQEQTHSLSFSLSSFIERDKQTDRQTDRWREAGSERKREL